MTLGPADAGTGTGTGTGGFRLVARDLRLHLGDRDLLDGVELDVEPGDIVAVRGPSGAGKTSLLLILAGVLRPDSGSVSYEAVPSGGAGIVPQLAVPVIGFVPQTLGLAPGLTAAENVALTLQVRGIEGREMRQRVTSSLDAVGLGGTSDRLVTDSRAASASGSQLPGPSPCTRTSSSRTKRPRSSTPRARDS